MIFEGLQLGNGLSRSTNVDRQTVAIEMDKLKQDAHIIFAMAEDGSLRQIRDVANGFACNCFCIACRMPVLARQGSVRQWHFAHSSQHGVSCEWAAETALHFAMKQLIEEERQIFLPEMHVQVERTTSWGQTVKRTHSSLMCPTDFIISNQRAVFQDIET